ncbi:MAG: enoyl-CoA hydratase [Thermodesulfobacteriota bacterium]
MEQPILFELDGPVAIIRLNRPGRRNAINEALLRGLYDSLERVARDSAVKVAIITGTGKAFCSGLDLDCLATDNLLDPRGDGRDMVDLISACEKPIIGAINGYAITGGFELALNCDFLVAAESASFADTHARVGIQPGWGMTQLLQQAVGQRMAKQMSFTCQFISAAQALRCGLVNEVVPDEELLPRARAIAEAICAVNYDMLVKIKRLIEHRNQALLNDAMDHERKGLKAMIAAMAR